MNDEEFTKKEKLDAEAEDMKKDELECHHVCTGNCRRIGCNCECGEWHHNEDTLSESTAD